VAELRLHAEAWHGFGNLNNKVTKAQRGKGLTAKYAKHAKRKVQMGIENHFKKPMNSQKCGLFWGNTEGWKSRLVKASPSKKIEKIMTAQSAGGGSCQRLRGQNPVESDWIKPNPACE
jgi:hypothetical protein